MKQTYKVFFNNRILYITDNLVPDVSNRTVMQKYTNSIELQLFVNEFSINQNLDSAIIIGVDTKKILSEIKTFFKYIEAAGGIVTNGFGELLFIQRLGVWDLPKGKMEHGETPEQSAVREVMEECGIDEPQIEHKITDTYHTYQHKGKTILKRTHWYALKVNGKPDLLPQIEEDITEVCWRSEWTDVFQNTYPSIVDVLEIAGYKRN